jgi:hypothetical protein
VHSVVQRRRESQLQIKDVRVLGARVDELFRIGSRRSSRVAGTLEWPPHRKLEYAAAGRYARASRLLDTHGSVESFVVVVPTSGLGGTVWIDQWIYFQSTVETASGCHEMPLTPDQHTANRKKSERPDSVFT